jgi:hypothetical protein
MHRFRANSAGIRVAALLEGNLSGSTVAGAELSAKCDRLLGVLRQRRALNETRRYWTVIVTSLFVESAPSFAVTLSA